ncbi:MAG: EpsI family protein [Candidatus Omnitrophica bacterium]|nr:EpsI family protein [Candidatus Omnitrophota bacterium]
MILKRSWIFIIIAFIYAGILSWSIYFSTYTQKDSVDIAAFPKTIGGWTSEDVPISKEDKAILETDNVFVRRYTNPAGEQVFLFIVYSQHNRKVSHPPEICYTGGGATIVDAKKEFIGNGADTIAVNRLKSERAGRSEIFCYWFKVGDQFTSNYWEQQILIAWRSFLRKSASSALIRISSSINSGEPESVTMSRIKKFGSNILPSIRTFIP